MNLKFHSRKDYEEVLKYLLCPLLDYYCSKQSSVKLPNEIITTYSVKEGCLESFSRSLLGLTLLQDEKEARICMAMIRNGVNPNSDSYWGTINDYSQICVELFPVLLFCVTNVKMYDSEFSKKDKENLEFWFNQINHVQLYENNWQFFPILVNLLLSRLGLRYSKEKINKLWKSIDQLYLGNGWYSDGKNGTKDYYIAFAFHFYSLLTIFFSDDSERNDIIRIRADAFYTTHIWFFSDSGSAIPFGRSLTYKFAHIAFLSIYSNFVSDKKKLSVIKGLVNRNLRWWFEHDILTSDGLLANGYAYKNPFMLEQYNAAGSPYWAFKAFFCLFDPNSVFFDVEELPHPVEDKSICILEADICIVRNNGNPFSFINGQNNNYFCGGTDKYCKFVYSSLFGFNISRDGSHLSTLAPDSTLVVHVGNTYIKRSNTRNVYTDEQMQISDWAPLPGLTIRTFLLVGAPWHTRIHQILSNQSIEVYDFGFSIKNDATILYDKNLRKVVLQSTDQCSAVCSQTRDSSVSVNTCVPYANVLYSRVITPYVLYHVDMGMHLCISSIYGDVDNALIKKEPASLIPVVKNATLSINGKHYDTLYYPPLLRVLFPLKQILHNMKKIIRRVRFCK